MAVVTQAPRHFLSVYQGVCAII